MQSIQNITLEWAILHTADSALDAPRLADEPIVLDNDMRTYFEDHIKSCIRSSQLRMGKFFSSEDTIAAACDRIVSEGPGCFMDVSHAIAWWVQKVVERSNAPTTDLAVCPFVDNDTDTRYVALLKLDPMRVYARRDDEQTNFEQILVLPTASHGLTTWALVKSWGEESRYDLLYRASSSDDYWTSAFLECDEISTPKQMTKIVLGETTKLLDAKADEITPDVAMELTNSVREAAQSDMIDLEELAEKVIPNAMMRDEYIGRMLDKGLTETKFEPDKDWAERQAKKTTYLLDDGVTVAGPRDLIDDVVQMMPKTGDGKTRLVIESKKFIQK